MKVLNLQVIVVEEPAHKGMQGQTKPTLVEGCKHDHLIVPRMRHFPFTFQSPPRNISRGDEPILILQTKKTTLLDQID